METSLARRQRHRRNGNGHGGGRGTASKIAVAIPLLLFGSFLMVGLVGFVVAVSAYSVYSQGLGNPKDLLNNIQFAEQTVVYDSRSKNVLARFGAQKREVVNFIDLALTLIDAARTKQDHTFWDNAGFDPMALVSAGL